MKHLNVDYTRFFRVCACALLFLFSGVLEAKVVYVDGSLTSDCLSSSYSIAARKCTGSDGLAYRTLLSGMNAIVAGDTLAIRGGTYRTSLIITKNGTASASIKIRAYNGESVVIDMSGISGSGIEASNRQWIEVSGLRVKNASIYGFKGSYGSNISLSDCEISYSYHAGVVFENASNVSVRNCAIHHNNQGGLSSWHEGITFENVDTFEILNSDVYENRKDGIVAKYNARNGLIANNRVYRNLFTNIFIDAANNIDVVRNVCYETASDKKACIGISIESDFNPSRYTTYDVRIINNLIWGSGAGIWFWIESPELAWSVYSDIRVEYNTFVDNNKNNWGGIFFMNGTANHFNGTNTIRNNIFMGNGGYGIRSNNSGILTKFAIANNLFQSGETSTSTGTGAAFTSADPFVNRSGKDFKLVSGAAARGMGLAIADVKTDIEGRARPLSATDVGAYQSSTSSNLPPPFGLRISD